MHVLGSGPLTLVIAAALRAAVPTRAVIALDTAADLDALVGSAFIVGVAEDGATAPLHRINRFACAHGIPWLPIRATPETLRFGPTVLPGTTACLLCAELRAAAHGPNLPAFSPLSPLHRNREGAGGEVPTLAALEVLRTLIGEPSQAHGHLGLFDRQCSEWTWHAVLRHPLCPACGMLPWPPHSPPPSPVGKGAGGLGPSPSFVDDETGIIRAVLPVPCPLDEPEPPHVALALLGNTQFRDDWDSAPPSEQTATGKGWTVEAARHAAIGESLERYCAMLPPSPEQFTVASHPVLNASALGPNAFGLYHPAHYADGSAPYAPVSDTTALHWVAGHSLTHDRPVLVPASLVSLLPLDAFCQQTSSGLAAGVTYAEASLRALCEVIERDAFLCTWLMMRPAPLLDLATSGEAVARIVRQYAAHGVTLTAHDLTTTTGVPVVMARAHDTRGRAPVDLIGLGCDPDPQRAVERAVLEVVQGRRARWDELAAAGAPQSVRTPSDHACWYALTDHSDAFAFLGTQSGPLPARVGQVGDDADAQLAAVVALLTQAGHEAVVVDITTPDVRAAGMTVVRALVTGLLPIHFGIGQERLGSARLAGFPLSHLNRAPHPLA